MPVTFRFVLDTRRIKQKTANFPVKLRVIFDGSHRNYQTVYDLTAKEFQSLTTKRSTNDLQKVKQTLTETGCEAGYIVKQIQPFSFPEFERRFIYDNPLFHQRKRIRELRKTVNVGYDFGAYFEKFSLVYENHLRPGCISRVYISYIKQLLQQDRIGSALNYQQSYNSLKKFRGNVRFSDITPEFSFFFEKWMLERGRTLATVGIQLRSLWSIFNEAIAEGLISKEWCYPFGRRKYQIPSLVSKKKAIHIDEIGKLYYYVTTNTDDEKAKDLWLFSYLSNGMNVKDMAYLKYRDIKEEYFVFTRRKTAWATRNNPKPITVILSDEIKTIIKKWGNKDCAPESYVFSILEAEISVLEEYDRCRSFLKFINSRMVRIGKLLAISKKLTTIVSRHSFSTQLKRAGASTEFIQESLGHIDKKDNRVLFG